MISDCGFYRYVLTRELRAETPARVLWVMLNPSIADAAADDATIRRVIGFSRNWGFGGLDVVNLYGLRATRPRNLYHEPDPVGPENDRHIAIHAGRCELVILAWGMYQGPGIEERRRTVLAILAAVHPVMCCLGLTKDGHPLHPLRVEKDTPIKVFKRYPRA